MRPLHARVVALACTIVGACGAPPASEAPPPSSVPVATTVAPPSDAPPSAEPDCRDVRDAFLLREWLRQQAVIGFPDVHTLYTWTRADQIDQLREDPTLLTRTHAADGALSALDQALEHDTSALAARIRAAGDGTRRFAWRSPWPTRLGWAESDYGERLLRVEISDDALVAVYDETGDFAWEGLFTMDGARVDLPPPAGAAGSFARHALSTGTLGLVLHYASGPQGDGTARAFREVVIVDEAVVVRYEYGTPRIASELDAITSSLSAYRSSFPERDASAPFDPAAHSARLLDAWHADGALGMTSEQLWDRALALGSERYRFDRTTIDALVSALAAPQPGPPIDVAHVGSFAPRRRARRGGYRPTLETCLRDPSSLGGCNPP